MGQDPRDHGFAWVVLVSAIVCNMLFCTVCVCPTLILVNLTEAFSVSTYEAGWITSINAFVLSLGGAPSGFLIEKFGCKIIGLLGATLGCVSLVLSALCSNVILFIVMFSILSGIFVSLTHLPQVVIIQYYFNKRRPLATGLSQTGYSIGVVAMLPLVAFFIEYYGWRGALMLVSGICLNMCVCMMFYSPIDISTIEGNFWDKKQLSSIDNVEKSTENEQMLSTKSSSFDHKDKQNIENTENQCSSDNQEKKSRICDKLVCDCSLVKDSTFLMLAFSFALFQFGSELMFKATIPRAELDMKVTKVKASSILSALCLAGLISRCLSSFIANLPGVNSVLMYSFSIIVGGIIMIISSFINGFTFHLITTAAYGLTFGMAMTVQVVVVVDLLGVEKISRSQGLIFGLTGLMYLLSIPIAGWIYDTFHSFSMSFLLSGVIQCIGGFIALPLYCKGRVRQTINKTEDKPLRNREALNLNPVLIGSIHSLSNIR